jgi:hypothetical protein
MTLLRFSERFYSCAQASCSIPRARPATDRAHQPHVDNPWCFRTSGDGIQVIEFPRSFIPFTLCGMKHLKISVKFQHKAIKVPVSTSVLRHQIKHNRSTRKTLLMRIRGSFCYPCEITFDTSSENKEVPHCSYFLELFIECILFHTSIFRQKFTHVSR